MHPTTRGSSMADLNADLIGGVLDASQLADELRAAHVRIDALTQSLRLDNDCLGRIAAAAGRLDFETLSELADGVIAQLNISALTILPAEVPMSNTPEVSSGPECVICGAGGATDFDGDPLCRVCSGEAALAEPRPPT
jgi:hypothetical protein